MWWCVTKQIVLPDTLKITFFVKWVCLHCTIAVFHGYWTFKSKNLILKVVLLFQSFLVITVVYRIRNILNKRNKYLILVDKVLKTQNKK